ncbi:mevalonate kinase, partial [Patescibacteria group bacterium]|nr:mevalonate kinase [Patescibacteria group bacterium]
MKQITVSAPGKLILLGEHAVVYGKPAIIVSVAKRCFVTLTPRNDKTIKIVSENQDQVLDYPEFIISKTLEYFHKKLTLGFDLSINSQIPINGGMGSSSALAVSIAGAVSLFLGQKFDKEKINAIAYLAEQKKHGNPSGGDNSTCCFGGLVWFRKETPD